MLPKSNKTNWLGIGTADTYTLWRNHKISMSQNASWLRMGYVGTPVYEKGFVVHVVIWRRRRGGRDERLIEVAGGSLTWLVEIEELRWAVELGVRLVLLLSRSTDNSPAVIVLVEEGELLCSRVDVGVVPGHHLSTATSSDSVNDNLLLIGEPIINTDNLVSK